MRSGKLEHLASCNSVEVYLSITEARGGVGNTCEQFNCYGLADLRQQSQMFFPEKRSLVVAPGFELNALI